MIDTLVKLDQKFFLFLNDLHAGWLDPVMQLVTERFTWIPLYVAITVFFFSRKRTHGYCLF